MTPSEPTPTPESRAVAEARRNGLAGEMAKQASLGHTRYCVGIHTHDDGQVEEEWIEWSEAFARLRAEERARVRAAHAWALVVAEASVMLARPEAFSDEVRQNYADRLGTLSNSLAALVAGEG